MVYLTYWEAKGVRRTTRPFLVSLGALLGLAAADPALAKMLAITCTGTQTWKDGTALKTNERFEITPETLGYLEYHQMGDKMMLVDQGTLEKLEPAKITFSDDATKLYYIDRTTGEEYWRDQRRGAEAHGLCKEAT